MSPVLELGRPIAEAGYSYPAPASSLAYGEIITPLSPIFTVSTLIRWAGTEINSGPWESINDPLALPFMLDRQETVYQLGWRTGSAGSADNSDLGIYDAAWARIVSTGSTACTVSSTMQWVDIADTVLAPRTLYYLVQSRDTVTASRISRWAVGSVLGMAMCGVQSSATDAFPLPNPLTNMADVAVFTHIPVMMMAFRSLV